MPLDTLYTVETPEGIALSLRPAGIVPRCQAYLIDFGIRLGLFVAASIIATPLGGMGRAFLLIAYFGLEWLYPVVFELARGGATPGKRAMGLAVVMDSGLPITPAASLTRNLLRAADFLPFLYGFGAAAMLLRPDFKRLGDMAAGTLVVYNEHLSLHADLPLSTPVAPTRVLGQREQVAIVAWAGRAQRLTPERFDELAQLARSVLPASAPDTPSPSTASQRLLGVAQWVLGRRDRSQP